MTNNNSHKENDMTNFDDFDTQIQSDEDFRAGITDEEWNEMQALGIDGIDDEDFGDDEMFRLGDEMFRFDIEENQMATVENGEIVWSDEGIDVVYYHETDDFELWVEGCDGWESRNVFDKSADAVKAAIAIER